MDGSTAGLMNWILCVNLVNSQKPDLLCLTWFVNIVWPQLTKRHVIYSIMLMPSGNPRASLKGTPGPWDSKVRRLLLRFKFCVCASSAVKLKGRPTANPTAVTAGETLGGAVAAVQA